MSNEIYAITNLEGYASQMREAAAKSLTDSTEDNLDDFISIGQIINMLNEECLGFDEENRPLLDEATNERIYENTSIWIHEVGLAKLAAKDLVECAWDSDSNEMIFWKKENEKQPPKSRRKDKGSRK